MQRPLDGAAEDQCLHLIEKPLTRWRRQGAGETGRHLAQNDDGRIGFRVGERHVQQSVQRRKIAATFVIGRDIRRHIDQIATAERLRIGTKTHALAVLPEQI